MKKILLTIALFLLVVNLVHFVVYQKQDYTSISDLLVKFESYPQQDIIDLDYIYKYQLREFWENSAGAVVWGGGFFDSILDFFQFVGGFFIFMYELIFWIDQAMLAPFIWLFQNFFKLKDLFLYVFKPY